MFKLLKPHIVREGKYFVIRRYSLLSFRYVFYDPQDGDWYSRAFDTGWYETPNEARLAYQNIHKKTTT